MSVKTLIIFVGLVGLGLLSITYHDAGAEDSSAKAIFAGGCFWCMEPSFEELEGVSAVISGYSGGPEKNPSYTQVSSGSTGHLEVVRVSYDPIKTSYEELLEVFWRQIDPTDAGGQFADRGISTRPRSSTPREERRLAEESRDRLATTGKFDKPIVTEILPRAIFYPAEEYHQDFYIKNPAHYNATRRVRAESIISTEPGESDQPRKRQADSNMTHIRKPSEDELKKLLTPCSTK